MSNYIYESKDPSYVGWPSIQNAPGKIGRQVLLATPTGKRPIVRPRTRWSDYISDHAWSRLGVEPAELSEIAVHREASLSLLDCFPATVRRGKAGMKMKKWDNSRKKTTVGSDSMASKGAISNILQTLGKWVWHWMGFRHFHIPF